MVIAQIRRNGSQGLLDRIRILRHGRTSLEKVESLLNLVPQRLSELGRRHVGEAVDPARNGALVREEAGDPTLVLGAGTADEGRVVDETVLGVLPLVLRARKRAFSAPRIWTVEAGYLARLVKEPL